ncbi:hypothetical protein FGB62_101g012 [Gracilaria domingensis]|nr:hypothetical protein FGB62_101g012 [Gracilaria domingensis]
MGCGGFQTYYDPSEISVPHVPDRVVPVAPSHFDDELDASRLIKNQSIQASVVPSTQPEQTEDVSTAPNNVPEHVRSHYDTHICEHGYCKQVAVLRLTAGFGHMNLAQRVSYVRARLLALSSSKKMLNELVTPTSALRRKRKRDDSEALRHRRQTVFALRGKSICVRTFATVTQLSPKTIQSHVEETSADPFPMSNERTNPSCPTM